MNRSTQYVSEYALKILEKVNILGNPYFKALESKSITMTEFGQTQAQFYFAVDFFSRPMSALMTQIPNTIDRLDILHNIIEEHGEFKKEAFHSTTFIKFLNSMNVSVDNQLIQAPPSKAFNNVLMAACMFDEIEVGIACLGIIERAFADISSFIAQEIIDNNWVKEADLFHYKLHKNLDIQHSEEFFNIIETSWKEKNRSIIEGLELGAYILDRLYRDLYKLVR